MTRPLSQADQALLDICIGEPEALSASWSRWIAGLPGPPDGEGPPYPAHWRDLLPLVAYRQRQTQLTGPQWMISRLRMAALLEERRLAAVHAVTADILALASVAARDPLIIGGLALGETVYPHPATRHTGVLTLMLAAGTPLWRLMRDLRSRHYRVRQAGWRMLHVPLRPLAHLRAAHPSGFQFTLLSAPLWSARAPLSHARLRHRAQDIHASETLRFLAPHPQDAAALLEVGIGREWNPLSLMPAVDRALLHQALPRSHQEDPT